MLPHSQHAPTPRPQCPAYESIPYRIGREFLEPERAIVHRPCRMLRAVVPEATIHEDHYPLSAEHKIGFPEDRRMPPPAGDAMPPQQRGQRELRRLVSAPANARHDLRPFSRSKDISHRLYAPLRFP